MLVRETAFIRMFALRVPVLLFLGPRVLELDEEGCAVEIPLGWRSKNHVGSMYFGALCAGADIAAGLNAFRAIRDGHSKVVPLFKDVRAEFLKRADGDVVFRARDGRRVAEAVRRADESGERFTLPVEVVATVPRKYGEEPVARFTLGLSLRRKDTSRASERADGAAAGGHRAGGPDEPRPPRPAARSGATEPAAPALAATDERPA